MALTFEQMQDTFCDRMAGVFGRWQDEHEYEAGDFAAYFAPAAQSLGLTVVKVTGNRLVMTIVVQHTNGAKANVTLTRSGMFSVKRVKEN